MAKKTTTKNAKSTTKAASKSAPKAQVKKAAAAKAEAEHKGTAKPAPAIETPPARKQAPTAGETTKAEPGPRPRDPRLPAPGTVLQKKDRQGNVRCECTVEEDGIRYKGALYRSLSAAAMAASKDLGIGGRATNGYLYFGLIRQPARETDPIAALERAWERYRARAEGILQTGVTDENRAKVLSAIRKHVDALEAMRETVA